MASIKIEINMTLNKIINDIKSKGMENILINKSALDNLDYLKRFIKDRNIQGKKYKLKELQNV